MKKCKTDNKNYMWITAILVAVMMSACGENTQLAEGGIEGTGSGGSNITIAGAVQKGPFIVGSSVTVSRLDDKANPTDRNIETRVTNSIGEFSFVTSELGVYQIIGDGYFFNELTGNLSSDKLTLNAIYEITSDQNQTAYVNILTHLINERVIYLIKMDGANVSEAIAQAEEDFVRELYEVLPIESHATFTELSIYNGEGADKEWNAYLLALSVGMYKYAENLASENGSEVGAELESLLNTLAKDLENDGVLQTAGFIEGFQKALQEVNPEVVIAHLQNRSSIDFESPLDVPDISKYLGPCVGVDPCPWREGTKLPVSMARHASVDYQGKIYLLAGVAQNDDGPVLQAYAYNPVTEESTQLSDPPWLIIQAKAHVINEKIYVVNAWGIAGDDNRILVYSPADDSWEIKGNVPTYRTNATSAAVGTKIYVTGGNATEDGGPVTPFNKTTSPSGLVEIYDVETGQWTQGAPSPYEFQGARVCTYNNKIYHLFHGMSYVYDTAIDSWSTAAGIPQYIASGGMPECTEVGGDFYIFSSSASYKYSVQNDEWTQILAMPAPRDAFSTTAIGADIYLIGGVHNVAGEGRLEDRVDIYDTQLDK